MNNLQEESEIDLLKYFPLTSIKANYLNAVENGLGETPYWQGIRRDYLEG